MLPRPLPAPRGDDWESSGLFGDMRPTPRDRGFPRPRGIEPLVLPAARNLALLRSDLVRLLAPIQEREKPQPIQSSKPVRAASRDDRDPFHE